MNIFCLNKFNRFKSCRWPKIIGNVYCTNTFYDVIYVCIHSNSWRFHPTCVFATRKCINENKRIRRSSYLLPPFFFQFKDVSIKMEFIYLWKISFCFLVYFLSRRINRFFTCYILNSLCLIFILKTSNGLNLFCWLQPKKTSFKINEYSSKSKEF